MDRDFWSCPIFPSLLQDIEKSCYILVKNHVYRELVPGIIKTYGSSHLMQRKCDSKVSIRYHTFNTGLTSA